MSGDGRARGGFAVCLDDGPGDPRAPVAQPPAIDLGLDVRFRTAPMKLALVGGIHPLGSSKNWTVVARNGTPTRALKGARLFPFTQAGRQAAIEDAGLLRAQMGGAAGDWEQFTARVLVEGPWERPEAVTPVWVVEGLEAPVPVKYYFS